MRILPCVAILVLALVSFAGSGAETPANAPLGSAAFVPTPERPVGWRGDGTGRFPGATPPLSWERKHSGSGYTVKNIIWAAPMPNTGVSSPVIAGDRIFVTAGFTDLVCIDKKTGRLLWIRSNPEFECLTEEERKTYPGVAEKLDPLLPQLTKANTDALTALNAALANAPTSAYVLPAALTKKRKIEQQIRTDGMAVDKKLFTPDWPQVTYGFCTETPCTDGKRVCALFATGVAACYDMDGNRKWIARGSIGGEEKGHYSSPIIMGGQFIVWGEPELRSYDIETGKVLWKVPARGSNCESLNRIQAGNDLVVGLQNNHFVRIRDGQRVWNGPNMQYSFTTMIVEGNLIYGWSPGYKKNFMSYAIPAATDSGKVAPKLTFKKPEWEASELPGKFDKGDLNSSPLFVDGLVYNLYVGGGLSVLDATTGDVVYRKVLPLKQRTEYWGWGGASASPALAGKYIYLVDNQGTTLIIEPGRVYKEVAVNRVEEMTDTKVQNQNLATPVFEGTRLYHRTPGHLYCIGEK